MTKSSSKDLLLEGKQIYLRPVTMDDVNQDYCRWLNDPEVNQYLETRFAKQTVESIGDYVSKMVSDPDQVFLAMCTKDEDRHIGNIKLGPIKKDHRTAEVSLFIGERSYWGKGIASEAIYLISKFAFEERNIHKLLAGIYSDNRGSQRAFDKAGYKVEGRLTNFLKSEGGYVDYILVTCEANQLRRQ